MFWPRPGVALLVPVTMLQCPRCSLPLTVAHCRAGPAPAPCCDPAPAPRLYPAPLLQQVQETRAEEERIAAELQSLHIRVLQNQLQAAKLQQQLASSQLPPPVSSCAASPDPDTAEAVLARCRAQLAECGWYHGRLSWQQSRALLAAAEEGTFLVRDSQDPRFLYSLSLARAPEDDGPTSIRILFARGKFSLDADDRIRQLMPQFESVAALVSYYASLPPQQRSGTAAASSWSPWGCPSSRLLIRRPLYAAPPRLAHCARLVINRRLQAASKLSAPLTSEAVPLQLPPKLLEYLHNYSLSL